MRKFLMSLFAVAGMILGGSLPASATAVTGLTAKPAIVSPSTVEQVHFRRHGGIFLGFGGGYGGYGGYPYYGNRYYNNYGYSRPSYYSYSYAPVRRHHRHWSNRHDRWEY